MELIFVLAMLAAGGVIVLGALSMQNSERKVMGEYSDNLLKASMKYYRREVDPCPKCGNNSFKVKHYGDRYGNFAATCEGCNFRIDTHAVVPYATHGHEVVDDDSLDMSFMTIKGSE